MSTPDGRSVDVIQAWVDATADAVQAEDPGRTVPRWADLDPSVQAALAQALSGVVSRVAHALATVQTGGL